MNNDEASSPDQYRPTRYRYESDASLNDSYAYPVDNSRHQHHQHYIGSQISSGNQGPVRNRDGPYYKSVGENNQTPLYYVPTHSQGNYVYNYNQQSPYRSSELPIQTGQTYATSSYGQPSHLSVPHPTHQASYHTQSSNPQSSPQSLQSRHTPKQNIPQSYISKNVPARPSHPPPPPPIPSRAPPLVETHPPPAKGGQHRPFYSSAINSSQRDVSFSYQTSNHLSQPQPRLPVTTPSPNMPSSNKSNSINRNDDYANSNSRGSGKSSYFIPPKPTHPPPPRPSNPPTATSLQKLKQQQPLPRPTQPPPAPPPNLQQPYKQQQQHIRRSSFSSSVSISENLYSNANAQSVLPQPIHVNKPSTSTMVDLRKLVRPTRPPPQISSASKVLILKGSTNGQAKKVSMKRTNDQRRSQSQQLDQAQSLTEKDKREITNVRERREKDNDNIHPKNTYLALTTRFDKETRTSTERDSNTRTLPNNESDAATTQRQSSNSVTKEKNRRQIVEEIDLTTSPEARVGQKNRNKKQFDGSSNESTEKEEHTKKQVSRKSSSSEEEMHLLSESEMASLASNKEKTLINVHQKQLPLDSLQHTQPIENETRAKSPQVERDAIGRTQQEEFEANVRTQQSNLRQKRLQALKTIASDVGIEPTNGGKRTRSRRKSVGVDNNQKNASSVSRRKSSASLPPADDTSIKDVPTNINKKDVPTNISKKDAVLTNMSKKDDVPPDIGRKDDVSTARRKSVGSVLPPSTGHNVPSDVTSSRRKARRKSTTATTDAPVPPRKNIANVTSSDDGHITALVSREKKSLPAALDQDVQRDSNKAEVAARTNDALKGKKVSVSAVAFRKEGQDENKIEQHQRVPESSNDLLIGTLTIENLRNLNEKMMTEDIFSADSDCSCPTGSDCSCSCISSIGPLDIGKLSSFLSDSDSCTESDCSCNDGNLQAGSGLDSDCSLCHEDAYDCSCTSCSESEDSSSNSLLPLNSPKIP